MVDPNLSLPYSATCVTQKRQINLVEKFGGGGEGIIYKIQEDSSLLVKVYKNPPPIEKLKAMLDKPPEDPMLEEDYTSITWPQDLVANNSGEIIGYLMPKAGSKEKSIKLVPYLNLFSTQKRLADLPEFTYQDIHIVANNLALVFAALHDAGYVIGDVNESNALVTEEACVSVVDTDSFQVTEKSGRIHRCLVGKPDYTPPELQGKKFSEEDRTQQHDCFGLAVLIFQVLTLGFHPTDGKYKGEDDPPNRGQRIKNGEYHFLTPGKLWDRPKGAPKLEVLHPKLQKLFSEAFVTGHTSPWKRPSAETWLDALEEVVSELKPCDQNPMHYYGSHLIDCPWCEQSRSGMIDPFSTSSISSMRSHTSKFGHRKQKKRVMRSSPSPIPSFLPAPSSLGASTGISSQKTSVGVTRTKRISTILRWTVGYGITGGFVFWLIRLLLSSLAPELRFWLMSTPPISFQYISPLQWTCAAVGVFTLSTTYYVIRNRG